jgi:hypothetical protein
MSANVVMMRGYKNRDHKNGDHDINPKIAMIWKWLEL